MVTAKHRNCGTNTLKVPWKVKNYHPLQTDPSCFRNDELNINIFIHVDDGMLFGPRIEVLRLVELSSNQVMMRIVERMEKLGDKIFFLGRVIERTARGYSVEANRDRCAWPGKLETRVDSKCEEDTNDRITGRTGERETSRVQDRRGKAVVHVPSDWAGQHQTCKSTRAGVAQRGSATLSAWSRTQQSVSLSSAEAELYALTSGISEGMVTKHLLEELGYEVTLVKNVESQSAKA